MKWCYPTYHRISTTNIYGMPTFCTAFSSDSTPCLQTLGWRLDEPFAPSSCPTPSWRTGRGGGRKLLSKLGILLDRLFISSSVPWAPHQTTSIIQVLYHFRESCARSVTARQPWAMRSRVACGRRVPATGPTAGFGICRFRLVSVQLLSACSVPLPLPTLCLGQFVFFCF